MHRIQFALIALLILTPSLFVSAQDDCVLKLNEAKKLYENGRIEQIPELVSNCIELGFNREDKIQALRLLTLVYLSEDNSSKAEKTLLKLLKIDPEYKVNSAIDPIEFIKLFNSFNTSPVFSIGLFVAPGLTKPFLIEPISRNGFKDANPNYTASSLSINFGIKSNLHINSTWDISFEPSFSYLSFLSTENIIAPATGNITETINYLNMPLLAAYFFYKKNNIRVFAEAGGSYDMFLSGTINGLISYNDKEFSLTDQEPTEVNTKNLRSNYNIMALVGVGAKIDLDRSNIQVGFRYKAGLMNQGNKDLHNEIVKKLAYDYVYSDNLFSLNNILITIGYNREFYIHKKKPNNQTNYDVLRQ